jgi:hypothetical protein
MDLVRIAQHDHWCLGDAKWCPASDMCALDVERGRARCASLLHDAEREGERVRVRVLVAAVLVFDM